MTDPTNTEPTHNIDAGAPTDNEARLAAQLATIGENPLVDPDAAPATPEAVALAAAAAAAAAPGVVPPAAEAPAADASPAGADDAAAATAAAAAAAAAATAPAPAPAPVPVPAPVAQVPRTPIPEAPKDFDAEFLAVQKRYDDGEIDSGEFQAQSRALSKEEGVFNTRLTLWQEEQARAANAVAVSFEAAAAAWIEANKTFMANPLRQDAMNRAIAVIDAQTGHTLSAEALIARAAEVAFEAFDYKPSATPAAASGPTAAEAALAAATAGRTPPAVPQTLSSAPAAASMERPAGNTAYGALDGSDINSLELALAKMSPDAVEAYLRDAPGATTSGKPSGSPE